MPSSSRCIIPVLLSLFLGLSLVVSACSFFSGNDAPLPDSTFTRVLVDLHLATARGERLSSLPPGIADSVFKHHGVQREEFDASLRYYTRRPEALEKLYNGVIDTLSALETRLRQDSSSSDTTRHQKRTAESR